MGAAPGRREERALEVEPERLGAVGRGVAAARPGRVRRTRRASASGAVTAVGRNEVTPRRSRLRAMPSSAAAIAHRVVAAPAVDVDVDEARGDDTDRPSRRLVVELDRGDPPVLDRDPAARDPVVEDQPAGDGARRSASSCVRRCGHQVSPVTRV